KGDGVQVALSSEFGVPEVVYLDPPWGGPLTEETLTTWRTLPLNGIPIKDVIVKLLQAKIKHIILKTPGEEFNVAELKSHLDSRLTEGIQLTTHPIRKQNNDIGYLLVFISLTEGEEAIALPKLEEI